jgi:ElaB/YqjD/DUF883 family membrane-anchored ribosome-binding protein
VAEISYEFKQLLIDDAHLRIARALLMEARDDLLTRVGVLEKTQSSVDRLMAMAGRPRDVSRTIKTTQDELTQIETALENVNKVVAKVLQRVEEQTETYVRTESPEFVKGLATAKDFTDWTRSIERFQRKLDAYLRALGTARNMVTAGYDPAQKRISPKADEALAQAILAGGELEEETAFINRVADAHQTAVAATPHADAVLPRLPVALFREWTERIRQQEDMAAIQAEFNRILSMCELLQSTGVMAIDDAVKRTAKEHTALSHSYVLEYLNQLRAYTDKHWLKQGETTQRVRQLETDLLGAPNFPFEIEV